MQFGFSILKLSDMHLCLWLHPQEDPAHDEWVSAMERVQALGDSGVPVEQIRTLVVTDGGAPNAAQRKQLASIWNGRPVKGAVLTTVLSNPIKRGIATAMSWINPELRFFRPDQIYDALAHLEATGHTRRIWTEYQKLQAELPRIATLNLVEATLKPQDLEP